MRTTHKARGNVIRLCCGLEKQASLLWRYLLEHLVINLNIG